MRTLLLAILVLVAASSAATAGTTVRVEAAGFSFAPAALVVPAGTTVEWQAAFLPHTVTTTATLADAMRGGANDAFNADASAHSFNAGISDGEAFEDTFVAPGEFAYFCELHYRFGMVGVVRVV